MLILNGKQKKKNCAECLCHVGRDIYHPALEHVFGDVVFAETVSIGLSMLLVLKEVILEQSQTLRRK